MKRRLMVGLALAVIAAVGATLYFTTRPAASTPGTDSPIQSTFSMPQAEGFTAYPLYNAGSSYAGYPLTAVLRNKTTDPNGADYVSFIYGDCRADAEQGCAPPYEIQVWPACRRNPTTFQLAPGTPMPYEAATIRGVPSGYYEDGGRLEVHTGTSTVVIFGLSKDGITGAANALVGVNNAVSQTQALPAPAAGALDGKLTC